MASCSLAAPSTSLAACESRRPAPLEQLLAEAREAGSFGPTQPASHGRLQASCDLEEAHRRRMEAQARRREDARLREQWAAEMLTYVNSHQLGWQQFLLLELASLPASANKTWGVLRHEFLTAYHASRGDPDSAAKPSVDPVPQKELRALPAFGAAVRADPRVLAAVSSRITGRITDYVSMMRSHGRGLDELQQLPGETLMALTTRVNQILWRTRPPGRPAGAAAGADLALKTLKSEGMYTLDGLLFVGSSLLE